MPDLEILRRKFREMYRSEPRLFSAPGRVNLIGEHTDYNDGFVLPAAIDRCTVVAAALRTDRIVRATTLDENATEEFDLDAEPGERRDSWLNYVEGVARTLEVRDIRLKGADLMIQSTVPIGAGLSSSAALEIAAGMAMAEISGAPVDMISLALAAQAAEHNYVGTRCGIMDQISAALGRRGHALLIDCRTLDVSPIPVDTTDMMIVLADTNVKHSLASSEYNTRRAECEQGVEILREFLPDIRALRDVTMEELEEYQERLPETIRRRCRHVIAENARTLQAAQALHAGELEEMGELMAQSHSSLRDDYDVSCPELDVMVEIASGIDGVIGARMTGGGFGGCTVNLVRRDVLEQFQRTITEEYQRRTGIATSIYCIEIGDGARELRGEEIRN